MEKSEKESIKLKLRNVHLRIAYLFMAADGKIEDTELNYFNEIGNCCSTFETQKENIIKYCEDVLDSKHTPISAIKRIIKSNPISLEGATSFLDYFSCSPSRENASLLWVLINLGYIDGDYSAPEREIVELISKECKFPPDVLLEMEDIARNNNYFLPIVFPKKGTYNRAYIEWFEEVEEAEDGQYCVSVYTLPANRTVYFTSGIRYLYHKLNQMDISLPTFFKVQIPEDVNCVYIGDLNYTVAGDRFETTKRTITDTYDDAVEFLKTVPGLQKETLCRAELNALEESDLENIVQEFSVEVARTKRFKMINNVYSYR